MMVKRISLLKSLRARSFSSTVPKREEMGSDVISIKELKSSNGKKKVAPAHKVVLLTREESGLIKKVPRFFEKASSPTFLNLADFEKKRKNLLVFKSQMSHEALISSISEMKPSKSVISVKRYQQIKEDLDKGYSLPQLRDYLAEYKINRFKKKAEVLELIISKCWKIEKSDSINNFEDLLVQKTIDLSSKELFFLVSQNGRIIYDLMKKEVKIILIANELKLIIRGTRAATQYVQIAISNILENVTKEIINTGELQKIFDEYDIQFPIMDLQQLTEAYFEKIDDSSYEIHSLGKKKSEKVKRLLLWSLNSNSHLKNELILPDLQDPKNENLYLSKYVDDECLDWVNRTSDWYRLKQAKGKSVSFKAEDIIFDEDLDIDKVDISELWEFKSTLQGADVQIPKSDADNVEESPQNSEIVGDDIKEPKILGDEEKRRAVDHIEGIIDTINEPNIILDKESIYSNLTNFAQQEGLKGVDKSMLSTPLFSVTFGDVLFSTKNDTNMQNKLSTFSSSTEVSKISTKSPFIFNTKIPFLSGKVMSLPFFGQQETFQDAFGVSSNKFSENDNHTYFIQLKFLPCPFTNIDNFKKYPPVEMWMQLNRYSAADFGSLQVMTAELENSTYINLPKSRSDLKFSCSINGNLVEPFNNNESDETQTDDLLEDVTERKPQQQWLEDQPGIKEYLKGAKLSFDGHSSVHIPQTLNIKIGDNIVPYHYININYRRQLDFEYKGRLLQYSVIEGGALGARKFEVNMIGNISDDMSKEDFDMFVDEAVSLVESL